LAWERPGNQTQALFTVTITAWSRAVRVESEMVSGMGWLERLRAVVARDPLPEAWIEARLSDDGRVEVVGESHHQDALVAITGRTEFVDVLHECVALLIPEPSNPHDPNAVAVHIEGHHVGYLSREEAPEYGVLLRALWAAGKAPTCVAVIAGHGEETATTRNMGVFLHLAPADEC
jgi:HIRAN domain